MLLKKQNTRIIVLRAIVPKDIVHGSIDGVVLETGWPSTFEKETICATTITIAITMCNRQASCGQGACFLVPAAKQEFW